MSSDSKKISLAILVVDDEANIRKMLSLCLETEGHRVVAVGTPGDALAEISRRSFDVAFVDLRLGTSSGLDLIPALINASPGVKIVVITAYASIDTAVEAIKRGATDYIPKPFTPAQIKLAVHKICEMCSLEQKVAFLREDLVQSRLEADFSSESPAVKRAVTLARQAASSDATLLLRGESGTGKSVLARAIHGWSNRTNRPFSVLSCPSLSPELLESELFGHAKGAFTGAVRESPGRIGACDGGTLMLDEIGDLPLALQPKLLRFVQDREYERVGDYVTRQADVRIIAATNLDLETGGPGRPVPGGSLLPSQCDPDRASPPAGTARGSGRPCGTPAGLFRQELPPGGARLYGRGARAPSRLPLAGKLKGAEKRRRTGGHPLPGGPDRRSTPAR